MLTVSLHEPLHALPWPPASSPRNICGLRLVQAARGAMVTMSSVARAAAMRSSTGMRDRPADALEQEGQVVDHEVADPDGERRAVGEQCLQCAVRLQGFLELQRKGLVEGQQVDLVDAELARTLLEAVQGLGVSVIADPNLGLKEDFRPLEARALDRLADLRCRRPLPCRCAGSQLRAPSRLRPWSAPVASGRHRVRARGSRTPLFR